MKASLHKLAIPAIFAGITEPVISITDTALVGRLESTDIAAVGLAGSIISMLAWVLNAINNTLTVKVGNERGAGNESQVLDLVPAVFIFVLILSVFAAFIVGVFSSEFLMLLDAGGELLTTTRHFLLIRLTGLPVFVLVNAFFGLFKGFEDTKTTLYVSLMGMIINVLLDMLLIHGVAAHSGLGVNGAAIASVSSQVLMLTLCFFMVRKYKINWRYKKINTKDRKYLLRLTSNLAMRTIVLNIALLTGQKFAVRLGVVEAAGYNVFLNLWLFMAFFVDGYANAGLILTGFYSGKNDFDAIKQLTLRVFKINLVIAIGLGLAYFFFDFEVASFFTNIPEVQDAVSTNMPYFLLLLPVSSVAFSFDGIYIGLGRVDFLRNVLIVATLTYLPTLAGVSFFWPSLKNCLLCFMIWVLIRGLIPTLHFLLKLRFDR